METNEMKPCELALKNLREELRKGILDESIETNFTPYCSDPYFADVDVKFAGIEFKMTVSECFICYHNDFVIGLFDEKKAFEEFKKLIKKHCKTFTHKEISKIARLQAEIDAIKKGGLT